MVQFENLERVVFLSRKAKVRLTNPKPESEPENSGGSIHGFKSTLLGTPHYGHYGSVKNQVLKLSRKPKVR